MFLLVIDDLDSGVRPLFVNPVEEKGRIRLEIGIVDEQDPEALDVLNAHGHRHLSSAHCLLSLTDDEFEELERLIDCLPVRVATAKDLFVRFIGYRAPIHVHLLTLLLDFDMVRLDVVDEAIDQLDGLLKALDKRLG